MDTISISQLKMNPSKAIGMAVDYPVAVDKRGKTEAYIVGKNLYDRLLLYIENFIDKKVIEATDYKKGVDFEKVAKELGI